MMPIHCRRSASNLLWEECSFVVCCSFIVCFHLVALACMGSRNRWSAKHVSVRRHLQSVITHMHQIKDLMPNLLSESVTRRRLSLLRPSLESASADLDSFSTGHSDWLKDVGRREREFHLQPKPAVEATAVLLSEPDSRDQPNSTSSTDNSGDESGSESTKVPTIRTSNVDLVGTSAAVVQPTLEISSKDTVSPARKTSATLVDTNLQRPAVNTSSQPSSRDHHFDLESTFNSSFPYTSFESDDFL